MHGQITHKPIAFIFATVNYSPLCNAFTSTFNNQHSTINNRNPFSAFTSTLNNQQSTINNRNPFSAFTSTLNNQQSTINNRNSFSAFTSTFNNQHSTINTQSRIAPLTGQALNTQQSPGIDPRDYNLFHRYAKPESTALPVVNTLKVYPNPVSDELTIEILDGVEDGVVTVELFDLPGKKMFSGQITISSSKGSVNLGGVKNGIYLLKISDAYGNRKTARIVVNK